VVVTAGPTYEAVDAVRFLGNRSSGKMGFALAQAAAARGAEVLLIAGPVALATPPGVGARVDIESAADLARAVAEAAPAADVVVMAAAVADFRPVSRLPGKLSRREATGAGAPLTLELQPNADILAGLGTLGRSRAATARRPFLVGFAAEMAGGAALLARARAKLAEKGCDAIVANDVSQPGIGFGADDNEATIVFADGQAVALPRASKRALAEAIWDAVGARLGDGVVAASAPVPGAAVAGAPRSVGKGHA
jgi:phosphopantothenoylcysteine decarboxylase/phosphopantothenate--cysteine ligase